jgi:hypothetical protein
MLSLRAAAKLRAQAKITAERNAQEAHEKERKDLLEKQHRLEALLQSQQLEEDAWSQRKASLLEKIPSPQGGFSVKGRSLAVRRWEEMTKSIMLKQSGTTSCMWSRVSRKVPNN